MQLIEIDKAQYRKRLNIVIVGFIASLLVLSLLFGQALIAFFAEPTIVTNVVNNEPTSNFRFNFLGVVLALLACTAGLHWLKSTLFFKEIYYVWQLKQINNHIYRKLKKIKKSSKAGDVNALIILSYYYQSLKKVYLLDDNTLTMSTLDKDIQSLNEIISSKNLSVSAEQFEQAMLKAF